MPSTRRRGAVYIRFGRTVRITQGAATETACNKVRLQLGPRRLRGSQLFVSPRRAHNWAPGTLGAAPATLQSAWASAARFELRGIGRRWHNGLLGIRTQLAAAHVFGQCVLGCDNLPHCTTRIAAGPARRPAEPSIEESLERMALPYSYYAAISTAFPPSWQSLINFAASYQSESELHRGSPKSLLCRELTKRLVKRTQVEVSSVGCSESVTNYDSLIHGTRSRVRRSVVLPLPCSAHAPCSPIDPCLRSRLSWLLRLCSPAIRKYD